MEFTANRKQFLAALAAVGCTVEKKTSIPILTGVKLTVGMKSCTIAGTDLEVWIQQTVSIHNSAAKTGELVIPLTILQKFLSASKAEHVTIGDTAVPVDCRNCQGAGEIEYTVHNVRAIGPGPMCFPCKGTGKSAQDNIQITSGATITVEGFSHESFPEMPDIGGKDLPVINLLRIAAADLIDMTDKVKFAISVIESRFTLNGFLLEVSDKVRVVATDGHRMCCVERGELPEGTEAQRAIVPKRIGDHVAKVFGMYTDLLTVLLTKQVAVGPDESRTLTGKNGDYAVILGGETIIAFRILSGTFPDYKRVLPNYEAEPGHLKAADFLNGIDGIKHASDERSGAIKLHFNCEAVKISAGSGGMKASIDVPCVTAGASGIEVGLNWKYVREFVAALPKVDLVTIHCRDAKSAWELRSASDPGYRYVLMPMRI